MKKLAWLCVLAAFGAQADVYKWVDEKGQTQYTETPPPAGAQKLNVPTGGPATAAEAPAAAPAADPGKGPTANTPEAKAKRCEFEKAQQKVLQGGTVTYKDSTGKYVALDPAKLEAAKKQVEDNIKTYCP